MTETSPASPEKTEPVLLGRITGVHGLKGEVKIAAYTSAPGDIVAYGALTSADGRSVHISAIRSAKGGSVIAALRRSHQSRRS